MTDTTEVERFEPYTDEGNREGYGQMEPCEGGDWVRATDYDALAAKLAEQIEWVKRLADDLIAAEGREARLKAKLAAAERRERQLLDTTATCRMLLRELNTAKAKLAKVEEDRDDLQIALASARKQLERYIGEAEAALVAAYRLALADVHRQVVISGEKHAGLSASRVTDAICAAIRALPTPTAAELMARIQTGEKE